MRLQRRPGAREPIVEALEHLPGRTLTGAAVGHNLAAIGADVGSYASAGHEQPSSTS